MTDTPMEDPQPKGGVAAALRQSLGEEVGKVVIGQRGTLDLIATALLVGGHALLEGPPGTAKTLLASSVAKAMSLQFGRVQFTPDMLPSDLTGTMTLRGGELTFRPGPVFANIVLADEINRTPPKTQAALLEAMQEGSVTVDGTRHQLPQPFMVIATENPIEYEGTYPLPEAQLDRFLVKIVVGYPSSDEEAQLLGLDRHGLVGTASETIRPVLDPIKVQRARAEVDSTMIQPEVLAYVSALVRKTRDLPSVALGASPRAGVHLLAAAKATARLRSRSFVTPDDVVDVAPAVLSHRLSLRPEAELDGYSAVQAVQLAVQSVPVPR